nr:TaqI-like C-terminal specificity domain-containing protein [Haloarchaeobius sp. FL176]
MEDNSKFLGQYLYVNVGATVASSESGGFVKKDVVCEEPVGNAKKFIQGTNVGRWYFDWEGEWLDYRPDEMSGPRHSEMFEGEKLLVRKRTDKGGWIAAAYDDEGMYCDDTVLVCCDYDILKDTGATLDFEGFERLDEDLDLPYAVALLNSTLMTWLFKNKFETGGLQGTYSDVWPQSVRSFPIPDTDGKDYPVNEWANNALTVFPNRQANEIEKTETPQELVSVLSEHVIEAVKEQRELNLNILDYLSIPGDELPDSMTGDSLGDIQIPVEGAADTPITETTKNFDSLRVEGVSFEDDGRLLMTVDISYKPDEDDSRETDTWGRLVDEEFETYDALAFVGLSKETETLIRNFVPAAVEKGNGFAGFRKGATKTNSPLDRLKDLKLPDIEIVRNGLERYTEVKSHAEELDEMMEETGQLIDEIIYDLYDLTDEEVEIVESAV